MKDLELNELFGGNIYHVCTDGTNCPLIMKSDDDFKMALIYLSVAACRFSVQIAVYCLMSNHVHVLVLCDTRKQAQDFIRHFKQLYSTYLSKTYSMHAAMKGVADSITLIESLQYLRRCIAYILRNPMSARVCKKLDEYSWSSYSCYFRSSNQELDGYSVASMSARSRRRMLRIDRSLEGCTLYIDSEGKPIPKSFVRSDFVERVFSNSGKSFLYYLGSCNDSEMEYDLTIRPQLSATDSDLANRAEEISAAYFSGKSVAALTTREKCKMLKKLYYSNRTSIPQMSRVLGLPRNLVQKILST